MTATKQVKVLSVRLPGPDIRRIKSLAAVRGVSVQEAVHQALETWALEPRKIPPEPLDALQGSLADIDFETLMQREKDAEFAADRRWS